MQWLYENLIEGITITPSSIKVGSDIDNIKNYHLSKYFSFEGNTGSLVLDFETATNIKNIFIMGTNLTSSATISVEANATDVWTSPSFSDTMDRYKNGSIGLQKIEEEYRYWKISITDSSITDIRLGYLFFGNNLQLPAINPDIEISYNTNSTLQYSISGQTYGNKGINFFSGNFTFPMIYDVSTSISGKIISTREDILEFWLDNQGVRPFIFLIFEESLDWVPPMMAVIQQNSLTFKFDKSHGFYSMSIKVLETF